MPRISLRAAHYAKEDFSKEVLSRMAYCGYNATETAEKVGLTTRTFTRRLENPDTWKAGELRKLNKLLSLSEPIRKFMEGPV